MMQVKRQLSIVLLVCCPLLLAMSVSCEKVDSNLQVQVSNDKLEPEVARELEIETMPDNFVSDDDVRPSYESQPEQKKPEVQTIEIPSSWKRLSKQHEIWIDKTAKSVIVAGEVCLNQGPLEMFICPQGTKEHESVISANALSSEVHGALIFLGADPGKACSWDPEYRPAYGPTIDVTLMWHDDQSNKTVSKSARHWIRNVNTQKPMAHQWVFGGSEFWEDPDTHEQVYYGDSGEMICLSNFSTATIDLNVESSDSNAGLLFEAFTENIPSLGTKVYAIIKPGKRIEPENKIADQPANGDPNSGSGETDAVKEIPTANPDDAIDNPADSKKSTESADSKNDKVDDTGSKNSDER